MGVNVELERTILYTLHDTFDPPSLEGQKCHEAPAYPQQCPDERTASLIALVEKVTQNQESLRLDLASVSAARVAEEAQFLVRIRTLEQRLSQQEKGAASEEEDEHQFATHYNGFPGTEVG